MINRIRADLISAKKEKNKLEVNLLTTLLSEIMMVGKNDGDRLTTDIESIRVIKKFVKNIKENLKEYDKLMADKIDDKYIESSKNANAEITLLSKYIPSQMSIDELSDNILLIIDETNINNMSGMGVIMKNLKSRFDGRYDGKIASNLVRSMLSNTNNNSQKH